MKVQHTLFFHFLSQSLFLQLLPYTSTPQLFTRTECGFNMKAGSPIPRRLSSLQVGDESRQPQQSKFNRELDIL